MADHPVLLFPFALLTVSFFIDGNPGFVLMSIAFLLVLYLSFTSGVDIKGKKIVIRLGRPIPLAKKEISLDEIVEIIELPSAGGVRIFDHLERPWVVLGILLTGCLIGALLLLRGEVYGILWLYTGALFIFDYLFKPSENGRHVFLTLMLTAVAGLAFVFLKHPEFSLAVIAFGAFKAMEVNENYTMEAIIIRTEEERIVLLGSPESKENFLNELRKALGGG